MARGDAIEDCVKGGFGLPDINNSWSAFKFSWLRGLWVGDGLWIKLFKECMKPVSIISDIRSFICNIDMVSINRNLHKVKNHFWVSVLKSISPMWSAYQRKLKNKLVDANIFGSNYLNPEGEPLMTEDFPNLGNKVNYMRDIISHQNERLYNVNEASAMFPDCPIGEITDFLNKMNGIIVRFNIEIEKFDLSLPFRPLIVQLINISEKGCAQWTKLLRFKFGTTYSIMCRERKWGEKLGRPLSIMFWERQYRNTSLIFWDNRLKLFHYKIIRHCLMTNEIVGQFLTGIEKNCTFCNNPLESISHLFWECQITKNFVQNVYEEIRENYPLYFSHWNKRNFIFSDQGNSILSPHNIFSLYLKYYIWISRCNGVVPIFGGFSRFFNNEISLIKAAFRQKVAIDRLTCLG